VGYSKRLDATQHLIEDLRSRLPAITHAGKLSLMSNKESMFRLNVVAILL
jgi:hypothetical protein